MATHTRSTDHPPGSTRHALVIEDAAGITHRELVGVARAFGNHLLAMADLIEAEPFNDADMLASDARFGELHARMRAASEKFAHARFCVGGVH